MQLTRIAWLIAALLGTSLPAAAADVRAHPDLNSSEDKIMYALGLSLAERLAEFELTPEEIERVQAGLADGLLGREPRVSLGHWGHRAEMLLQRRREEIALRERRKAEAYLEQAAREDGAVKRASGLIYRELRSAEGPRPGESDRVEVHYHGTRIDGSVFDSSVERGKPSSFEVGGVIRCWTEALQMMSVGTKARIVCPPQIAYGRKGMPGKIKPGATLTFEVELLDIVTPASPR